MLKKITQVIISGIDNLLPTNIFISIDKYFGVDETI